MHFISIFTSLSVLCLVAGKYRLPTNVKPTFYTIKIHPDLDTESFNGDVSIHFRVKSLTDSIAFHNSALNITSLYLNTRRVHYISDPLNSTLYYTYEDYDLIRMKRRDSEQIAPGSYMIHVKYTGKFSKNGKGFFKAPFTKNDTVLSRVAVTDFEPTHARSVFPCFDEPALKAKFQLTLITPNSSYTALSNMRLIDTFKTSYGQVHKFETTPVMSTYLIAFAITQYKYIQKDCKGVPIRIFSHDELNPNITEYACISLNFYQMYTGYCNVLPKIDFIEYDRDFSTATENWGLVTVRTGVLGKGQDPFTDGERVNIISHEISHFWFGNLVTNEWWDDIWLQEGFAVFIALKVEQQILNNSAIQQFPYVVLEDLIFPVDVKNKSNPIVNFAETPSKIVDNFSDITYSKGAALLLMVEMVLGERKLKHAIRKYIEKYAFRSASTNDLISIFEEHKPYNIDLRGFMESYLYQNTYPIIQVVETEKDYVLTQSSCSSLDENVESPYGYKWTIPLSYKTNNHNCQRDTSLIWFDKNAESLTIPKQNDSWIKFNPENIGLYRVNYSKDMWKKFIDHAEEMDISDKTHLFVEAAGLFVADVISCDVAIDYFRKIIEKNDKKTLPIDNYQAILVFLKLSNIEQFDKKAHKCVVDYFLDVLENYKYIKQNEFEGNNLIGFLLGDADAEDNEIKRDDKPSENMKHCINWIHKNFSRYCNNSHSVVSF